MNAAQATTNASESVPQRTTSTRKLVIRKNGGLWILSDDAQSIGGIFLSLDVALTYARREPAYVTGVARIVIVAETEAPDQRHAA